MNQLLTYDITTITLEGILACFGIALGLGIVISIIYMCTTPNYTKNFAITIVILPVIVQAVLLLVNGEIGTSLVTLAIFSLVRFRSVPGTSKEIATVFLTVAIGIAVGLGFPIYACIITGVVGVAFIVLAIVPFGDWKRKSPDKLLKVTIPENLDYTEIFTDIFDKYLKKADRETVKTVNMGTMFEITYIIRMKNSNDEKKLIDEIRTRNGNLTVSIGRVPINPDEL